MRTGEHFIYMATLYLLRMHTAMLNCIFISFLLLFYFTSTQLHTACVDITYDHKRTSIMWFRLIIHILDISYDK